LLTQADGLLAQGDYDRARQAYGEFASLYPDDGATPRAEAMRDVLGIMGALGKEVARIDGELRQMNEQVQEGERELLRLRRDLGTRDTELARARQVLAERQSELARLHAEAEQLRADLEKLKNVDLRLERRR
jgi:chromosome segregation ATPase